MDLEKGYKMPSKQNTEQVESPTMSETEQMIHDAMARATIDTRRPPLPPRDRPFDLKEMHQEMVDNLNRNMR